MMKKKILKIFLITLSLIIFVSFVATVYLEFFGRGSIRYQKKEAEEYLKATNWNCDSETFSKKYYTIYYEECKRLAQNYSLTFSDHIETKECETTGSYDITFCFYNKDCTVYLDFLNDGNGIGRYDCALFYYGTEDGYGEYEDFANLVNFINDVTSFSAYLSDADIGSFKELYDKAQSSKSKEATDTNYYYSGVGNVGYSVNLDRLQGGY